MSGKAQSSFPPGYAEQYIGYIALDVAITFTVLEVVAVVLRYISQSMAGKRFGIDDFLILPGLLFCLGINTCCFRELHSSTRISTAY